MEKVITEQSKLHLQRKATSDFSATYKTLIATKRQHKQTLLFVNSEWSSNYTTPMKPMALFETQTKETNLFAVIFYVL